MMPVSGPGPARLRPTVLRRLHPAVVLAGACAAAAALLVAPWPLVAVLCALTGGLLARAGWGRRHVTRLLKPWLPVALLVLAVHLLTTTSAAPLGHPSLQGAQNGTVAVARLACLLGGLALVQGQLGIDALLAGWSWLLWPLDGKIVPVQDLSLVLTVAVGTAPRVMDEGRRLLQAQRLRRGRRGGLLGRSRDRLWVAAPLLEELARRTETLSLTLRARHAPAGRPAGPGKGQLLLLMVWVAALVAGVVVAGGGA